MDENRKSKTFCEFRLLEGEMKKDEETGITIPVSNSGDVVTVELNKITTIDIDYDDGETIVKTVCNRHPIKVDMTFDEAVDEYNRATDKVKGCVFYRSRTESDGTVKYTPIMLPNARIKTIDISYSDGETVLIKTDDGRVAVAESFDEAVEEFNRVSEWTRGCVFTRDKNGKSVMVPSSRIKQNGIRESKVDGSTIVYTADGKLVVNETVEEAIDIYERAVCGKSR